ncbi:MAG: hypothetical protein GC181_15225 [Bacteroidetes bacterium]|nr:hypothetical protein [Bacteroidota bacterium]
MRSAIRNLAMFATTAFLSGCFDKDVAVTPYPRGDVQEIVAEMGPTYENEIFVSLDENRVVKTVSKMVWDISFSSEPGNKTIRINTGRVMYAAKTSFTELTQVKDTAGLDFRWDYSGGSDDSTALFEWWNSDNVWVLNMGMDADANGLGLIAIKFSMDLEDLHFSWTELGKNNVQSGTLKKDDRYNQVYFSLLNNEVADVEPVRTDYDLIFRQYLYYFADHDLAYLVLGAVLNDRETSAATVFDKNFGDIAGADTTDHALSSRWDVIGHDWKSYSIDKGTYTTNPDMNFMVKDQHGFLYKLHFTDFYSNTGEKGYPKMEFRKL